MIEVESRNTTCSQISIWQRKKFKLDDDLWVVIKKAKVRCPFVSVKINFFPPPPSLCWRFINRVSLWPDTHCVSFEEDKHWGPKGQGCLARMHAGIFTQPLLTRVGVILAKTQHTWDKNNLSFDLTVTDPYKISVFFKKEPNRNWIFFNLGSWLFGAPCWPITLVLLRSSFLCPLLQNVPSPRPIGCEIKPQDLFLSQERGTMYRYQPGHTDDVFLFSLNTALLARVTPPRNQILDYKHWFTST